MAKKQDAQERKDIKVKLKEAAEKKPLASEEVKRNLDMVEFSGLDCLSTLDPIVIAKFERICVNYAEKIERMLDNFTKIKIHIKATHKSGQQRKYEMDIKAISATKVFAGGAVEWDVEKAAHMCFKDIEKQIVHHFKNDVSYKKPYS